MPLSKHGVELAARVAVVFFALALPASIIFGRSALGVALALALVALLVGVAGGLRWPVWPQPARPVLILTALIAAAWLPSLAVSIDPAASAMTLIRTTGTIAFGVAFAAFLARDQALESAKIFIIGMAAALLFAVAALYAYPPLMAFRSSGAPLPSTQFKASASGIACALPLLVFIGWRLGGWWRAVAALCVLSGFVVMFGTSSKSSLAGFLAASALAGVIVALRPVPRRNWALAVVVVALLAVSGGAFVALPGPAALVGGYELFAPKWLVDQHRQVIWQFTLQRFFEHPWFGWGLNVINLAPGANAVIPELGAEYIPSHPHNWMVETLAESGVTGFLPLILTVPGVALAAARAFWRKREPAWLAWLAMWLAYWSAGAFNFSMWNSSWQASGMILAALLYPHLRQGHSMGATSASATRSRV